MTATEYIDLKNKYLHEYEKRVSSGVDSSSAIMGVALHACFDAYEDGFDDAFKYFEANAPTPQPKETK